MGQHLTIELLHKSGTFKIQHLKVRLHLDVLVIRNFTKKTFGPILNFHKNSGSIIHLLDPINLSNNFKIKFSNFTNGNSIK